MSLGWKLRMKKDGVVVDAVVVEAVVAVAEECSMVCITWTRMVDGGGGVDADRSL